MGVYWNLINQIDKVGLLLNNGCVQGLSGKTYNYVFYLNGNYIALL